jgi:hypothetical protein
LLVYFSFLIVLILSFDVNKKNLPPVLNFLFNDLSLFLSDLGSFPFAFAFSIVFSFPFFFSFPFCVWFSIKELVPSCFLLY